MHESRRETLTPILLTPLNAGEEVADLDEDYADFDGYQGFSDLYEVEQIAERIHAYTSESDCQFLFGFDCNADGEIHGFMISASLKDGPTFASWMDRMNATSNREATELAAAYGIADALYGEFESLRTIALRHQRLVAADDAPAWPQTDDEQRDWADWKYEVANGDTTLGFRAWLDNQAQADDQDTPQTSDTPITATLQRQAWDDDQAIDLGQPDRFDITPALDALTPEERQSLRATLASTSRDLDWLYERACRLRLIGRHDGPFYLDLDTEATLAHLDSKDRA